MSFADLVLGREEEFPTLALAAKGSKRAVREKIEWLGHYGKLETNYTQIVRFPYDGRPVEQGSIRHGQGSVEDEIVTSFLGAVESILNYGKPLAPYYDPNPPIFSKCGGVFHYLRRDLVIGDHVKLRPLREPFWMFWEPERKELLAEFSLEVTSG
jgi:hypothetical protein